MAAGAWPRWHRPGSSANCEALEPTGEEGALLSSRRSAARGRRPIKPLSVSQEDPDAALYLLWISPFSF